jgi:3-methyladenine DNA glycosylase AlkD
MNRERTEAPTSAEAMAALREQADHARARSNAWFFKTGPGQYGAGDVFLGLRLPQIRALIRPFATLPLGEIEKILASRYHEERLFALLVLVRQYEKAGAERRDDIFQAYIDNIDRINNWDLVDLSARLIGWHLQDGDRSFLYDLIESDSLWHRRIGIIATFGWIRQGDFTDALELSLRLLDDREDLIHKAVGWMLREIGNVDGRIERDFLRRHAAIMPRTMLRYAIEKFPEAERREFMDTARRSRSADRSTLKRKGRTAGSDDRPRP